MSEKTVEDTTERTTEVYESYCTGCDWRGYEFTQDSDGLLENHLHEEAHKREEHEDVHERHVVDTRPLTKLDLIEQLYAGKAYVTQEELEKIDLYDWNGNTVHSIETVSREDESLEILTKTPVEGNRFVLVRKSGKEYLARTDEYHIHGIVNQAQKLLPTFIVEFFRLIYLFYTIWFALLQDPHSGTHIETKPQSDALASYIFILLGICLFLWYLFSMAGLVVGIALSLGFEISRRFARDKTIDAKILDEREAGVEDGLVVLDENPNLSMMEMRDGYGVKHTSNNKQINLARRAKREADRIREELE